MITHTQLSFSALPALPRFRSSSHLPKRLEHAPRVPPRSLRAPPRSPRAPPCSPCVLPRSLPRAVDLDLSRSRPVGWRVPGVLGDVRIPVLVPQVPLHAVDLDLQHLSRPVERRVLGVLAFRSFWNKSAAAWIDYGASARLWCVRAC